MYCIEQLRTTLLMAGVSHTPLHYGLLKFDSPNGNYFKGN